MPDYLVPDEGLQPDIFTDKGADKLPGHLGFEVVSIARDRVTGRFRVSPHHHAPNGFLHGGTVVAFADTLCGYATVVNLRAMATGFTTIELKTNFFSTLLEGVVVGTASPVHVGGTTQVWDCEVHAEASGKRLASFRCTNLVLSKK